MAQDPALKALARIVKELDTLDDAGLRYVINRAESKLNRCVVPLMPAPGVSGL